MRIKTYNQALEYLNSFISPIIFKRIEANADFDPLDRMRVFLKLLGNPERKLKSILVTGTSGKGSTAYLISHILKTAGYKTGITISPHLQKVNERLQINGEQISDQEFIRLLNSILSSIDGMEKMPVGKPSYFEILIALAFLYFSKQKIDIAVVEVGIEGKYDATNTLNPLMVVLTNISLDHTQILGDTVEKIAGEAVGAIKEFQISNFKFPISNLAVVTGAKQKSVIEIVEGRCETVGAKLFRLGKDFDESIIKNYKLSLLGNYQKENASLAVEAVLKLKSFGFSVSEKDIKKALSTAFFPGRFEIINIARQPRVSDDARLQNLKPLSSSASLSKIRLQSGTKPTFNSPESGLPRSNYTLHSTPYTLILDGAHNPAKMHAFLNSLKKLFPRERKIFIVGFKFDKDISKMLNQIARDADEIIVTQFSRETDVNLHASADAESIKYQVLCSKYKGKVVVERDSKKVLEIGLKTIQQSSNPAILVVTGSLYLVGEVRSYLFSTNKKFI